MGRGMAGCLLDAGHTVTVFNRTAARTESLIARGAKHASTPQEAAQGADAVISMVGDDTASKAVWTSGDGALDAMCAGALVLECSTLSHDWVLELFSKSRNRGLAYLDAPVTGLPTAAAGGELTLFLGGDPDVIEQAQPVLAPLCERQIRFGDVGSGTAYKLIVNLMGSIQIVAAAEGLAVAEKAGLDLNQVADALGSGGAGSPTVARLVDQMVDGRFDENVVFSTLWRLKDTRYGAEFARKMGLESELNNATQGNFQAVADGGFAPQSEAKVFDWVRKT